MVGQLPLKPFSPFFLADKSLVVFRVLCRLSVTQGGIINLQYFRLVILVISFLLPGIGLRVGHEARSWPRRLERMSLKGAKKGFFALKKEEGDTQGKTK